MSRRHATLLLGYCPRIVLPIARSLGRRGVPVIVANWLDDAVISRSRSIARYRRLPDPKAGYAAFATALKDLVRSGDIDWIVPTSDAALDNVLECEQDLRTMAVLACPPPEAVRFVLDKHATLAAAEQCGIPIPRTYPAAEAMAQLAGLRFPVIAKESNKSVPGNFRIRYYATAAALTDAFERDARFGEKYLIQEYAPGVGVGVELLMWDGDPVAVFQHRRLKENPVSGGVSVIAVSESPDATLKEMAVRLLRRIGWSGPAMVEFRCDPKTGAVVLMEVNGRYWGSLALSIQSGVDFPGLAWELAHGSRPEQPVYRLGVKTRWTAGLILRQINLLGNVSGFPHPSFWRELPGTLGDLVGGAHDMLWTWRDPLPALAEAAISLRWLLEPSAILPPRRPVLLPLRIVVRRWRSLDSQCRPIFLKRRLLGLFRRQSKLPAQVSSVLFVCHGNIIRSAMAAELFRQRVDSRLIVASAGLHAVPGKRADARAILVSRDHGLPLDLHAACALTKELVQKFDLIVVMDTINEAQLLARYPEAAPKVRLLGFFARTYRLHLGEIADPYAGSLADVRSTWNIIEDAVTGLAGCLAGHGHTKHVALAVPR